MNQRIRTSGPLAVVALVGALAGSLVTQAAMPPRLDASNPSTACHVGPAAGSYTCTVIVDPSAAPSPTAAPTPSPTPAPTPTLAPTATPTASPTTSGPIVVTANNVTIDGVTISTTSQSGAAIIAVGQSAANPIDHLTIKNCTLTGFNVGISMQYVTNVTIQNCKISNSYYAGILILSGVGGTITGNTISAIGPQSQAASNACNGRGGSGECDSYGITFGRSYTSSSFTTDPRSANWQVTNNSVSDVPTWHCYDAHAGQNITFDHDSATHCMRGVFLTTDGNVNPGINVAWTNGSVLSALSYPAGGTTGGNLIAVTLYHQQGVTITGNQFSNSYGTPAVDDYQGASTGLTVSGNTQVP